MDTNDVVRGLGALAQASRLAIFRLLVEYGPEGLAAGRIAEALDLAPATLSFHLKELAAAGLIEGRQDGRFIHYSANFQAMGELLSYLTANCCAASGDSACLTACAPADSSRKRRKAA
jgi:ArsR family transcriptional regulator, arsenate/arsenite/antimonite-responsive transcriptional repressor